MTSSSSSSYIKILKGSLLSRKKKDENEKKSSFFKIPIHSLARSTSTSSKEAEVENIGEDYSSFFWPSSFVLFEYLNDSQHIHPKSDAFSPSNSTSSSIFTSPKTLKLKNKNVLELGAGMALPSLLCYEYQTSLMIIQESPNAIHYETYFNQLKKLNGIPKNSKKFICKKFLWDDLTCSEFLSLPMIDLIISSDCFYDKSNYNSILSLVTAILYDNPNCKFLTVYQERSILHSIGPLLLLWNLKGSLIPMTEKFKSEIVKKYSKILPSITSYLDDLFIYEIASNFSLSIKS